MSIAIYADNPQAVGARIREARRARKEEPALVATEAGISTFQLGKIERGEAGRRPTQKMASAIETLVTRYNIVAPRPPGARDPGPEAPPVVAALNSVPREIADAVEQLWQGQARLLSQFAEVVWRRAVEHARTDADHASGPRDAKIGRRNLRPRTGPLPEARGGGG